MSRIPDSQWDPNWDPYGRRPPKRGGGAVLLWVLLLGGLGSVLLIGFVGIVIAVASINGQWDDPPRVRDTESFGPAQPHDWAAVRTAYNSDVAQLDADMRTRLQPLLEEFLRCSNEDDYAAFRQIVDHGRFLREMKDSRFEDDINLYDQPWLRRHLIENVTGISGCDRMVIVAVVDTPRRGEKIVYVHGVHEDTGYTNPLRFWVVAGRRPRLFDWEMIEYGSRETGDWAISLAYDSDRRNDAYFDGLAEIHRADGLWDEGEVEAAYEAVRAVADNRVPPPLHDDYLLKVAYTWMAWSEPGEVHDYCDRIRSIENVPGALVVQAQAYQLQGRYAECLAAAERYEAIVGRTPASLSVQAESCEELQRWDEAKQHYADVLAIMPDDEDTLDAWAGLLEEEEEHLLAAHLDTLENKVQVATAMANRLSYNDDIVDALAEAVAKFAPDSPTAKWLRAVQLESDGHFEQAAVMFQQVIEDPADESQAENARYRYMGCVVAAGTTLKAYKQANDPQFVFDYLVEEYEYEGVSVIPFEELEQIVDTHLQRYPDRPWSYYYASVVKENGESPVVIEKLIRDGLRQAEIAPDDDANSSLNRRLIEVMFNDGRAMQAYRTIEPTPDTFRQLGDLYRYGDRPMKEFEELVNAHLIDHIGDPWLRFYRPLVQQRLGRLDQAESLLEQASKLNGDDDELNDACRYLWLDVLIEQERYLDAYQEVAPPDETFDYLARHLHDEETWKALQALIQQHRTSHPNDARALYWEVQMHWQQKNYDRVAALMRRDDLNLEQLRDWELATLRNYQLRSLLRIRRFDEARRLADQRHRDEGDARSLILVLAAAGDVQQTTAQAEEYVKTVYSMDGLYSDDDVGELLRGPEYADLRRIAPPSLPSEYGHASGVLLLDNPPALDLPRAQQYAAQFLGEGATARAIPASEDEQRSQGYLLADKSQRVIVTYGDDAYQADADLRAEGVTDKDLLDRYERHQGWIAIDILEIDDAEQATPLLHKMLVQWIDEHCLLVFAAPGWLLAADDEGLGKRLADGELVSDYPDPEVWLYRESPTSDAFDKWVLRRDKSLRQFSKLYRQRTSDQQFHLLVTLVAGDAQEHRWLPVVDVRRRGPRDDTFIVRLEQPSPLFPNITAGEHAAVYGYQVRNWKMTQGENAVFAYQPE